METVLRGMATASLRSSLANLSVDGSEDGRVSPMNSYLQRFKSKSSQYRSFNLKKTTGKNQEILDRLAKIRSLLPQNHVTDNDPFKATHFNRSPRQSTVAKTAQKSSSSATAV
ncbi:unnamed protein product [Enterobius vermicularis]|uniref:DET1- and DDB1-associated protein 1 n=1 Tax=Enterobius vermicularis TaxID=51028 RepID=A0A0N4VH74_ENTVE|nr:unnamed protein product [Enterobius vermicularis]